jgi:hypothetical protein
MGWRFFLDIPDARGRIEAPTNSIGRYWLRDDARRAGLSSGKLFMSSLPT